jgi:2-amino-4-hydroxy-6-hydroxymethyldihydropteridine diphosphokinase
MKFIALGSNLSSPHGTPIENLRCAIKLMEESGFEILVRAPVYRSAAVPVSDQPDFLNSVVQVAFDGTPSEALAICHQIEKHMGRERGVKNEARIIDLDILAWDGLVQNGPPELPHPRLHERAFVIFPLAQIAPDWLHPVRKETAVQIQKSLPPSHIPQTTETI